MAHALEQAALTIGAVSSAIKKVAHADRQVERGKQKSRGGSVVETPLRAKERSEQMHEWETCV